MDLHGMYRYFIDHHIVGLLLTTQMGIMMMRNYELPLRFLMVGGEKLTGFHIPPTMKLYNCYGPTEFAVCSAYHQVDRLRRYENIPIGRPVPNTVSVVVDSKGHLLPRGITGELCLIGRQIAQGYWNRPELTEESFTDCPFIAGEKMYHTRDLVRWNEEGELEYLGRMDNQLKIRGYRIELGEIEHNIAEYPDVTSAAVIVHQGQKSQYLVGYFTSKTLIDPELIQVHLKHLLPDYMIPQFLVHLSAMPMTINGKVNRQALIDSQQLPQLVNKTSVAPKTKSEKILYDLTKQVLKIDDFGVTDDLTLLGMTSLSAIKLADLADREGLNIKVNDILRSKSIRNILISEQAIGKWENTYDASKPVIVLIQGFTYYKKLEPLISKLCKHYSVFVIEPFDDHFEALFNEERLSTHDVVKFYLDYLEACLPSNVSIEMFIGHSFGGELAYRCAVRWHKKTNTMPKVCLFDTFAHVANIAKEQPIPQVESLTPDVETEIEEVKEWNRHLRQMLSLKDDRDLPTYDGNILYFTAEDLSMDLKVIQINLQEQAQKKQDDLRSWCTYVPHINIYPVAAGHLTMLDEQFCDDYIAKIDNIVLPHNS
jgi:surfactin family lipopeptide synthetase A